MTLLVCVLNAKTLHEEVLTIRRRVLEPEHPDTLNTAYNLAIRLAEVGRVEASGHAAHREQSGCLPTGRGSRGRGPCAR